MRVGYLLSDADGVDDALISALAGRLVAQGQRIAGAVQVNSTPEGGRRVMSLRLLPDGPTIGISQDLGAGADGCSLDPGALETAVALAGTRLETADLLIVNKFGRQEAEGRGFRELIAAAVAAGKPVILGVGPEHFAAFAAFAGDFAEPLPADAGVIAERLAATIPAAA